MQIRYLYRHYSYLKETSWLVRSKKGSLDKTNGVVQDQPLLEIENIYK